MYFRCERSWQNGAVQEETRQTPVLFSSRGIYGYCSINHFLWVFYHSIANFCVVSLTFVSVLTLQFNSDSVAQHNLYIKEHKVRAEKSSHRPMDRTLFVLNIPPYCSEVHLPLLGSLRSPILALFIF